MHKIQEIGENSTMKSIKSIVKIERLLVIQHNDGIAYHTVSGDGYSLA